MSATLLAEGSVFARRYRVVRLIAAGAMGAVHEVLHLETERRRALKVMHAHLFQSEEMRERFKREARIAGKVESEHIVDVFDAGVDEATGMPFLVMELLRGEELGERIKRAGRLPPAEVITYLHQAALALDRTHAASIVHRDLKPENLFLSQREDGSVHVKILDFGVAKLVAEGATAAGATSSLGTPIYMPPEQFHGGSRLSPAADVFALGMMAYTMLVGVPYWSPEASSADGVFAFAMVAARGPQEPPVQRARSLGVALPPAFDAWFARATAVDPAARFRRATEAVRALGEVLGVPVGGSRATFPSAPSWPGTVPAAQAMAPAAPAMAPAAPAVVPAAPAMAPAAPAMAPALMTTEPAPTRSPSSPGLERDARANGLVLAGTSTGAAVSGMLDTAARPSRGRLVTGLAVMGVGVLVGAGGWLSLRTGSDDEPSPAATDVAAQNAAAPEPSAAVSAAITGAPASAPAAQEPTTAAPEPATAAPEPATAAPEPASTGRASTTIEPAPTAVPPPPAPSPTATPASTPPARAALRPSTPSQQPASTAPQAAPKAPPTGKKPSTRPTTPDDALLGRH